MVGLAVATHRAIVVTLLLFLHVIVILFSITKSGVLVSVSKTSGRPVGAETRSLAAALMHCQT